MELRTDRYKLKEVFPDRAKKYAQKYHIKADEIEYVRKGIPIDPAEISIEEGERAAIRLITTPRLDRDGEILLPDGAVLDDFRQSPSVLFGHQYDKLPVGKDLWIKPTKKGILAKTAYANHQFAEDVFQCVKGGFLNSNSVGFIPLDRINQGDAGFKDMADRLEKEYGVPGEEAKAAKSIYTKWLLLEHSDVPVPSNAQSLNIAVSKGELIIGSPSLKEQLGVDNKTVEPSDPLAPIMTDSAVQPKIDFCNTCGTPLGEMVTKSEKYECECIKCGHKATFEEHCKDVKCPKCGGEMRRAERPGPGRAVEDGVITKPETTENYIRIPVDTSDHAGHRIRTITISETDGIKAIYCGTCKTVMTYLFDRSCAE